MPLLAAGAGPLDPIVRLLAQEAEVGFQLNLFWIIAQAGSFLLFLVIVYLLFFKRISGTLEERRSKIEQGLRDADDARKEREAAASERLAVLAQARTEAEDILSRAQKVADESRERDMAETRAQLEQMRTQAAADIASEKDRALADVRSQVAELALAAASRVVGETMTTERERRLVNEFLTEVGKN
ncbi:MAG TPA: F0F1 ATP synthase subunit B [Candidatus Limnocylindria bacterium]|nr:F0F1 ATP synthase subunit B [Candidatus Limnocylindria bacterium]